MKILYHLTSEHGGDLITANKEEAEKLVGDGDYFKVAEYVDVSELEAKCKKVIDSICPTDITGYYMGRLDSANSLLREIGRDK